MDQIICFEVLLISSTRASRELSDKPAAESKERNSTKLKVI